eukprot:COSAG03_NODE_3235_length_2130_cov_1.421467_1_plen_86_part_10
MGYALTFLLEDSQLIERFGIFEHMLSRLSADVLPFELLSARGDNMLSQLEMILGRTSTGWQVPPPAKREATSPLSFSVSLSLSLSL